MRLRRRPFTVVSTLVALAPLAGLTACPADDDVDLSGTAGSTGGAVETGGGPGSTGVADTTEGVSSTTGEPVPAMIPARGLHIDWVEANQGVGVPIGQDGAWVGPQDRLARLLRNRITLLRAFWTLEPDFEPREIEGHLLLEWPDGTTERLVQTKMIDDDAFIGDLSRVFFWGIEAEKAVPGLTYAIELYEHDPAYADGAPAEPPYFPSVEGEPVLVGIEDSYQLLKVTVVPFNYDDGGSCVTEPDTSAETMQLFQDQIFMMNPLDRLDFTLHEPVDWDTPLENFGQLNSYLSDLRFEEGAPPEMYYYGLVDVCAGGLDGAGGQAFGIPSDPTMDLAYQRVSSGLSLDPDWSAETFVHEVGHSQGRYHVACNGEEGGPDPTYPIQGGDVGEWGFGIIDFGLRHPTVHKDYMTYCHPVWVGTWGWNKVQPFVETLSQWDADFPSNGAPATEDPYSGSLLVGTIGAQGSEDWITVPGGLGRDVPGDVAIELGLGDGRVERRAAVVRTLADTADRQIVIPLPDGFDRVTSLARVEDGQRVAIDRARVRERHIKRLVRR
jgi:hypothetical protein